MDYKATAQKAIEVHGRDLSAWRLLVQEAQKCAKAEKELLLEAISQLDYRAASRFARDAGVRGESAKKLLSLAAATLDASEIGWIVENLIVAMGERRFVLAARGLEVESFNKVRYWAGKFLGAAAREEL
jgi:hypothetical protein